MPPQILIILVLIVILGLLLRVLSKGSPVQSGHIVRRTVGGALILVGIMLAGRGLVPASIPFFLLGLMVLGAGSFVGLDFPWAQKTPGQKSAVRTSVLAMELDHDSGDLDGEVLAGSFAGKRLGDLSLEQLVVLRRECVDAGDQSAALLDAYLDRVHPDWRGDGEQAHDTSSASTGGKMTPEEAYEVLGLQPGASASEVRTAHKKLMKKYHPDQGGSEYLAQKINQARDVLLGGASASI